MIIAAITALWQLPAIVVLGVLLAWSVNLLQRARESFLTSQIVIGFVLMIILVGAIVAIS